jgi:hypothetical protein
MRKRIAFLLCILSGAVFGLDDRPPLAPNQGKLRAAYHYDRATGQFDAEGNRQTWSDFGLGDSTPGSHTFPVQYKTGLLPGLDVEFEWGAGFGNEDRNNVKGFLMPEVGFKYLHPVLKAGGYANVVLPFAPGDHVADPKTGFVVGGLWIPQWPRFRVATSAQYAFTAENPGEGTYRLRARPEFMLNGSLVYLAAHATTPAGDAFDTYLILLEPGFYVPFNRRAGGELLAQWVAAGANVQSTWAVRASLHVWVGPR